MASLGGHSRLGAETASGVFAGAVVGAVVWPHPDAAIATTATAAIPERTSDNLLLHAAAAAPIAEAAGQQQNYDDNQKDCEHDHLPILVPPPASRAISPPASR